MSTPKLSIKDVNLFYGDFHALHGISMDIDENKITSFIGPSGCGKSTLLKSINRMNDLVEGCKITGEFLLDNKNIYKDIEINTLRKRVGMVFQKANPFPMSVYDNIAETDERIKMGMMLIFLNPKLAMIVPNKTTRW